MTVLESSPVPPAPVIRTFDARRDREAVVACVAALQDFERTLEPNLPPGDRIARRYVEAMLQRCIAYDGQVFVAERAAASALAASAVAATETHGDGVVGFVCVLASVPETAPDEYTQPHAVIGELFVMDAYRGLGLGRRLLAQAEAYARRLGAERLRVQVLAANGPARELYAGFGFKDRLIEVEKQLGAHPALGPDQP